MHLLVKQNIGISYFTSKICAVCSCHQTFSHRRCKVPM